MGAVASDEELAKQFQVAARHGPTVMELTNERAEAAAEFVREWASRYPSPDATNLLSLQNALTKLLTKRTPENVSLYVIASSVSETFDCRVKLMGNVGTGAVLRAVLWVMSRGTRWEFESWSLTVENES